MAATLYSLGTSFFSGGGGGRRHIPQVYVISEQQFVSDSPYIQNS
jgi:hypothetical protein